MSKRRDARGDRCELGERPYPKSPAIEEVRLEQDHILDLLEESRLSPVHREGQIASERELSQLTQATWALVGG